MHRQLLIKKILRYTRNLLILFFTSTLLTVIIYRFMPVYITPLMVIRSVQQIISGDKPTWKHTWVSFDKISPNLPMAVIASEDNRFAEHNGFDLVEIKKAMKENETRKRKRGASTISQQTAKNVFLWPQSSWVRKGLEVYFTFLIELFWSKERIMEVYLNSIEMGNGIYGAQATAKNKFGTTADKLTRGQCALIAADSAAPESWFGETTLTASGYAASLPVCGQTVSGTALRRALGLRSACFNIRYQDGSFLITTKGYGHGVGLSQWGAKALAEQGWTYEAILTHYFPGTQLCR